MSTTAIMMVLISKLWYLWYPFDLLWQALTVDVFESCRYPNAYEALVSSCEFRALMTCISITTFGLLF